MSWRLCRWVWLLESALSVGAPPAGSLNRCRLYVPARTLWGALTAEFARAQAGTKQPAYEEAGKALAEDARLTYLFPAERVEDRWLAWLPQYKKGRALVWRREDEKGCGLVWRREDRTPPVEDRTFRQRLVTTRAGAAIDPRSDTAAEGSLRETECVGVRWRCSGARVAMIGYVFVREGTEFSPTQDLVIHVGGDTRYGLGRLRCIERAESTDLFGRKVDVGDADPSISSCTALAHADAAGEADGQPQGALELLSGWDRSRLAASGDRRPLWAPGSSWKQELSWHISSQGIWKLNVSQG